MPGAGVELVVLKPETVISIHRDGVATEDLKGELATATFNGKLLGGGEKGLSNPLAPCRGMYDDIVHIQERLGFEGGIAFKTIDQADGLVGGFAARGAARVYWLRASISQKTRGIGAAGEVVAESFEYARGQRLSAPHRIAGIEIKQLPQVQSIFRSAVINAVDVEV